jgi:hypothetical protein
MTDREQRARQALTDTIFVNGQGRTETLVRWLMAFAESEIARADAERRAEVAFMLKDETLRDWYKRWPAKLPTSVSHAHVLALVDALYDERKRAAQAQQRVTEMERERNEAREKLAELQGVFKRARWVVGGEGSHWDGCEREHRDCALAKLDAALADAARLREKARVLLDMIYPADVFTGESGDPGAVAVAELRAALASADAGDWLVQHDHALLDAASNFQGCDEPDCADKACRVSQWLAERLKQERERCAKECDSLVGESDGSAYEDGRMQGHDDCAARIRALDGTPPRAAGGET